MLFFFYFRYDSTLKTSILRQKPTAITTNQDEGKFQQFKVSLDL